VLRSAATVEQAARRAQKVAARRATDRLIAAYLDAGWTRRAIADAMGRRVRTISHRKRAVRVDPQPASGIVVIPPPTQPPQRLDELDWLRPSQAAQLMGVHVNQRWTWRRAGLLPNTRTTRAGHNRYARTDLLGILHLRAGRKILPPNTAVHHGDPHAGRRHVAAVPRKLAGRHRRIRDAGDRSTHGLRGVDAHAARPPRRTFASVVRSCGLRTLRGCLRE
jgi:hypothetical protein